MGADDVQSLRRGLRDLVALTTLPTIWAGYPFHDIAESLSEVLLATLHLDLVYIHLTRLPDEAPLELVRTAGGLLTGDEAAAVGRHFAPWVSAGNGDAPLLVDDPLGDGLLQIAVNPIGHDGVDGVVVAGTHAPEGLNELDRLLMSVAVNQAVTALQQARLLADLRATNQMKDILLSNEQAAREEAETAQRRMHFLAQASAALDESLNYTSALERICQLAAETIADWCTIVSLQPDAGMQEVKTASNHPQILDTLTEIHARFPFDVNGTSAVAQVIRTRQTLFLPEVDESVLERFAANADHLALLRRLNPASTIVVPLQTRDHVLGAISLNLSASGRHYDHEDLALAEDLAHRVATAVDRARLYQAEQAAQETLKVRVRFQSHIAELGQEALVSLDLPALMNRAAAVLAEGLQIQYAKILEYLPDQDCFLLRAGMGWREGLVGYERVSAGLESQGGFAMMSHGPVIVEDLRAETRFHGPALLLSHGVVSGISVLIEGYERPWGILGVHSTQRRTFSPDDISFVQSVANILGAAVERARWYEQAQESATIQERQRIARELHDAVSQTLFSANLIAETLPGLWKRKPDKAVEQVNTLHKLTRAASSEMRVLLVELRPDSVVNARLGDLLSQLAYAIPGRKTMDVSVVVRDKSQEPLPADVQMVFYRIAQESLNNIVKHSGAKRARVRLTRTPSLTVLMITDNGKGFDTRQASGGFGLLNMAERAEGVGATLSIRSRPGRGTCIRLTWKDDRAATAPA